MLYKYMWLFRTKFINTETNENIMDAISKYVQTILTLEVLITATADDTLKYLLSFFFFFSEKIRLDISSESSA